MRVPAIIYADQRLIESMDHKVFEQVSNVTIPAGLGSTGGISLDRRQMDAMLVGGAAWAVDQGYGSDTDLERTEEHGRMAGADPAAVSDKAKKRQRREMGTLGSGNHYLEVQRVAEVFDSAAATAFGLQENDILVSIHCGSRGLGHQIGTEFLKSMLISADRHGIRLPDRELACAPLKSAIGRTYLGAMNAGINCALANRQILTHLTRRVFDEILPGTRLRLIYDVSHNTCKLETHDIDGQARRLFVHRKGATRALVWVKRLDCVTRPRQRGMSISSFHYSVRPEMSF
jgi:tRNA-splicing ligase RtcB